MAPRTKSPEPRFQAPPEVAADIEAARAELERGEGVELTPEELRRLAETGEWPERLG
jgi:hypothetical protein